MTTRDELDRVITRVAGELTRADAQGFGARVRARLDRPEAAKGMWTTWQWTAVTAAGALLAIVIVSVRSGVHDPVLPSIASATAAAAIGEPAREAITMPAPATKVAPNPPRSRPPATRPVSAAEIAWLSRALPPLPEAAPVVVNEVAITTIEPRALELSPIVVEALGARDVNK
jgi:hypothetical protein